jgi:serine/threonine-protein kinase HipA
VSQALAVRLHGRRIGTLSNLGGDYNLFSFDEEYLADPARPVLSQAFIGASGDTLRVVPRTHRIAPAFFSNLLPENGSLLRAMVARQYRLNGTRDFPFLRVLGSDLPGAVVIGEPLPSHEDDPVLVETLHEGERPLRFSLAGMQLKFSARMSGERLTIPVGGQAGTWIAKLPTKASGLPVPKILTIALDAIDHLPDGLPSLRSDEPAQAYVIERFDRTSEGGRVHAEDFNQIADQQPSDKYDHKTSSWIANVIATICPPEGIIQNGEIRAL